ncbi:MAG: YraN family protein [Myxococcales bacterium]
MDRQAGEATGMYEPGARTLAQQLGDEAEERAARYFEENGFEVLERKYKSKSKLGEVDLIVAKGLLLAFVEVRYRKSLAFGRPEETIRTDKRRKVILAAYEWAAKQKLLDKRFIRFDVVAVMGRGERAQVVHLEDAFDAELPRLAQMPFL